MSLNRNTYKTRLCVGWLMKIPWPEAHRNAIPCSPLGAMVSIHHLSIHSIRLEHNCHKYFPGGSDGKKISLEGGRPGFNPWVGKIPWRMATHSSVLAWRIPWTEEPGGETGGLRSIGLQRAGHDWSNLAHTPSIRSIWFFSLFKFFIWHRIVLTFRCFRIVLEYW